MIFGSYKNQIKHFMSEMKFKYNKIKYRLFFINLKFFTPNCFIIFGKKDLFF